MKHRLAAFWPWLKTRNSDEWVGALWLALAVFTVIFGVVERSQWMPLVIPYTLLGLTHWRVAYNRRWCDEARAQRDDAIAAAFKLVRTDWNCAQAWLDSKCPMVECVDTPEEKRVTIGSFGFVVTKGEVHEQQQQQ